MSVKYSFLLPQDEEHLCTCSHKIDHPVSSRSIISSCSSSGPRYWLYSFFLNGILLLSLVLSWAYIYLKQAIYIPNEVYTPAQSAIKYEQKVFLPATKSGRSPYQGSSDEINRLWEDLYNDFAISLITSNEAALLPNATSPMAQEPTKYMVQLDVFHQLHCLNLMRKLVYPSVFNLDLTSGSEEAEENLDHFEHCYDSLRQALQCNADLSTIYYEWVPERNRLVGNLATTHTCKNYDSIIQWARDHQYKGPLDYTAKVEGVPIRHVSQVSNGESSHHHM
ncbi:unnamed protein product [Clonostachys rosea]|uniref:Uncharacterized protein n=1 Tax=Bionectria ochroleuca TaxID=29856 RepID=A0ABY6UDI9_BIOOC|nr:unnamed protein product [Clonostachys rosea]